MYFLFISLLLLSFVHHGDLAKTAIAALYLDSTNTPGGLLTMSQSDSTASVIVTGIIFGLPANSARGFHVHQYGVSELSPNCTAAGAHFSPYSVSHGPREGNITTRHVGDLGNITTDATGTAIINFSDYIIDLYNVTRSILGLTLVVHAMSDDGGSTGVGTSNTTGNAGNRVMCGLIRLVSDTDSTTTTTTTTTTSRPSMAIVNNPSTQWILLIMAIVSYMFTH